MFVNMRLIVVIGAYGKRTGRLPTVWIHIRRAVCALNPLGNVLMHAECESGRFGGRAARSLVTRCEFGPLARYAARQ